MGSKIKKYKIRRFDFGLVIEAIQYIHADAQNRRLMREGFGDLYSSMETGGDVRMMAGGHSVSGSGDT